MYSVVATVAEEAQGVGGGDLLGELPRGVGQPLPGPRPHATQQLLELGEGQLDRVEVVALRRQVHAPSARGPDQLPHTTALVAGEVVHHDDVARQERRHQDVFDEDLERCGIDGPLDHAAAAHAAGVHRRDQRAGPPPAAGDVVEEPLSLGPPATQAREVVPQRRLIEEDQPGKAFGQGVLLPAPPPPPSACDVGPVPLDGPERLF